jgi:regulatory protein
MARPSREPPADLFTDTDGDADPFEVAKQIILQQLSHSSKTRHQLAEVLAKRGVPPTAAEAGLDRIAELGYLDDVAFARAWVESRHRAKGLSHQALRRELVQRGVAKETIDVVLADLVDEDSERAAARALVEKRLPALSNLEEYKATNRLVAMLGRKGYPPGLAFSVVREVLAEAS